MAAFEIYKDAEGEWRWRFRANNGAIVADSAEGYVDRDDCVHGARLLQRHAPGATIQDVEPDNKGA